MNKTIKFEKKLAKPFLHGPQGQLESMTTWPQAFDANATAIICHPHPLQGGTMSNKVVYTLSRVFDELGMRTVRFNFRGVGKSVGEYAEGQGEQADLQAVIEWVKQERPLDQLILAGFSFGSYVATSVASQQAPDLLVSVASPVETFNFRELARPQCRWVVVQGEADEVVTPKAVFDWLATLVEQPELIRMPDVGHFFHGELVNLRKLLINQITQS